MYSEGPLVRGFLSTQLSPSSRGNLDKELPVIMMFGWFEPDEKHFDESVLILEWFEHILNLEGLLGTVVT